MSLMPGGHGGVTPRRPCSPDRVAAEAVAAAARARGGLGDPPYEGALRSGRRGAPPWAAAVARAGPNLETDPGAPRGRGWGAAGAAGGSPGEALGCSGGGGGKRRAWPRVEPGLPGVPPGPPGGLLAKFAGGRERGRRWLGRCRSSRAACCRRGSPLLLCIEARPSTAKTPAAWRSLSGSSSPLRSAPLLPPSLPSPFPPLLSPLPCLPPSPPPAPPRRSLPSSLGRPRSSRLTSRPSAARAAGRGGRGLRTPTHSSNAAPRTPGSGWLPTLAGAPHPSLPPKAPAHHTATLPWGTLPYQANLGFGMSVMPRIQGGKKGGPKGTLASKVRERRGERSQPQAPPFFFLPSPIPTESCPPAIQPGTQDASPGRGFGESWNGPSIRTAW